MNFVPRAVTKKKNTAAVRKKVANTIPAQNSKSLAQNLSTSSTAQAAEGPALGKGGGVCSGASSQSDYQNQCAVEDVKSLGQLVPHHHASSGSDGSGKVQTSFSNSSRSSSLQRAAQGSGTEKSSQLNQGGLQVEKRLAHESVDGSIKSHSLSIHSHKPSSSHTRTSDSSWKQTRESDVHHPDRTHPQESQGDKLERLQRLSERISNQVGFMKGDQSEISNDPIVAAATPSANFALFQGKQSPPGQHVDVEGGDESGSDEEPPPIVSCSKNQRWPEDDEPVCMVCGKFGEYICDQTEADVCSLECKAKNLVRRGLKPNTLPNENPADMKSSAPGIDDGGDDPSVQVDETEKPYIYKEHPDVSCLTAEQVQDIRNEVQIFVEGINVKRPILEFKQLCLPAKLQDNLNSSGYVTPTPIQMQAIPASLALRDLMMCAQTSSGKTLSFLIPAVVTINNQVLTGDRNKGPYVLILTPTRELAMQIEDQSKQLMKGMSSMKTALIVGGLPLPPQLHRLRQGIQFIAGTPGRIMEIIKQQGVSLNEIKLVVIDEVDTMLQLGFQEQVYDIMTHLPDNHQTIFTSATIPSSIEKMASSLLNNPVFISVGTPSTPCASVKQIVLWVEEPSKKKKLFAILQDPKHFRPPAIVFVDSKLGADLLAQAVEKSCGLSVASLHGDKPQTWRNEILQRFREGAYDVMISTAVLGRGIDLPGVKMVINFDMPGSVEEYIHQIGRTGRLGTNGTAMTFINNNSKNINHAQLFLQFTSTLKPLGVMLPPELVNSPHLSYQRQQHRSRDRKMDASSSHRMLGGSSGYPGSKRNNDRESVTDVLKKRKRKFRP